MYNHSEVLKHLSEKDRQELILWEGLFQNPGFKLLLQKLGEQYGATAAVLENAPSWDSYNYSRGARDALLSVLNLESSLEFIIQEKLDAAKAEALDEGLEEFA